VEVLIAEETASDDGAAVIDAVDGAVLLFWSIDCQPPTAINSLGTAYTKQALCCVHSSC
jgi:hypothetical protein